MTPTMKLRFIKRRIEVPVSFDTTGRTIISESKDIEQLQQWFLYSDAECHKRVANEDYTTGEWVDVPIEETL